MVRALNSHQCGPGLFSGLCNINYLGCHEFVVGSCPCSKEFFSGFYGFLESSKTNFSKFQFDLDLRATSLLVTRLSSDSLIKQSRWNCLGRNIDYSRPMVQFPSCNIVMF